MGKEEERFNWPDGRKAAVSFSYDDARPSQLDCGIPLFNEYGIRATFFVSVENVERRVEEWNKAAADGHEVANHSMTHPCSGHFPWSRHKALEDHTIDTMRRDIEEANAFIGDRLGVTPRSFAYPCAQKYVGRGKERRSYVPLIAEMFEFGRDGFNEHMCNPFVADLACLPGIDSDTHPFEELKPWIDQAVASGEWLILLGHEIDQSGQHQHVHVDELRRTVEYVKAQDLWVDTIANVGEWVRDNR
jgi:peptidoglycan/xylan/chitin deacetylase (PgdA/CDA1 family)